MLTDSQWKAVYRSGDQNLLKEFYIPSLSDAVSYDRAVGFFSSGVLTANLQGITSLVNNGGKMRLIIGHPIDDEDYFAIKRGYEIKRLLGTLRDQLGKIVKESKNLAGNKLELLAWLIAEGRLEVKFALRRRGMYHEKIGIIRDKNENCIVFQGSANETVYALDEGYNSESLMVFKSWDHSFKAYGEPCIEGFRLLWAGRQKQTITVDMPSEFYEEISSNFDLKDRPDTASEKLWLDRYDEYFSDKRSDIEVPSEIHGVSFTLYEHQKIAIKKWWANESKGILKLATGSGKTITSLVAAAKVFEARKKLVLVVAVPYKELALQWVSNMNLFKTDPIRCWGSKKSWELELDSSIRLYNMNKKDFLSLVVVNKTLSTDNFSHKLSLINSDEIMFIGDECHNLGAEKVNAALPPAFFKLGLSATPFRSDEDEIDSPFPDDARRRILSYFGEIVDKYTLEDAITDGVLCGYDYHVIPIRLTEDEQEVFEELSLDIAKLIIQQKSGGLSPDRRAQLTSLCGRRSMLLGSASEKFDRLEEFVSGFPTEDRKHTLFYCGAGKLPNDDSSVEEERAIERVSKVLNDAGWRTSRFTSTQTAVERRIRMNEFVSGVIDGLVSIRVLDEGVDVPVCDKAIILASTRNPRQYVQRRGRVLRRSEGKKKAIIYDFVVLPCVGSGSSASKALLNAELERVDDFCLLATNKFDVEMKISELGMRNEF